MARLQLPSLERLLVRKGEALQPQCLETLARSLLEADECSTSGSGRARFAQHHRRYAAPARRYNLIQPVDTRLIDEELASAKLLQHKLLPVLRHGQWFNPQQVADTLERVPRMLRYQGRKRGQVTPVQREADQRAASVLLDSLAERLVAVLPDCSNDQLSRALWAYGASRRAPAGVLEAACALLPSRLPTLGVGRAATAAWALAAAAGEGAGSAPVLPALQSVASHLVATRPSSLTHAHHHEPASASSSGAQGGLSPGALMQVHPAASEVAAAAADRPPWMDHRAAVKLAWAFARAGMADKQAWELIGDAAAARIDSQLQDHRLAVERAQEAAAAAAQQAAVDAEATRQQLQGIDGAAGGAAAAALGLLAAPPDPAVAAAAAGAAVPFRPRATYYYKTVRGWQAWPRPRPQRVDVSGRKVRSRYLYDDRPRVVLRDFTAASLAPLLQAFARVGHRHDELLRAACQHIVASGPSQPVAPGDTLRLVAALERLGFRNPAVLSTLLCATQLSRLPAPALLHLATMAYGSWRVRHRTALARLAVQLHARAWIPAEGADAPSQARLTAGGAAAASEEYGGLLRAVVERRATEEQEQRLAAMEEEQWAAVAAGARGGVTDAVQPAQVARLLVAMAEAGVMVPSTPSGTASPHQHQHNQLLDAQVQLASKLLSHVFPHVDTLTRGSAAQLAAALVSLDPKGQLALVPPPSYGDDEVYGGARDGYVCLVRALLPRLARRAMYGSALGGAPEDKAARFKLMSFAVSGGGGGGGGADGAAVAVAEAPPGVTPAAAVRLAAALAVPGSTAAQVSLLRSALGLVALLQRQQPEGVPREELGALLRRLNESGMSHLVPQELAGGSGGAA